jgi:hypothetical protein
LIAYACTIAQSVAIPASPCAIADTSAIPAITHAIADTFAIPAITRAIADTSAVPDTAGSIVHALAIGIASARKIAALPTKLLARAGLTVSQRISARGPAVSLCRSPVRVRRSATMLRIVLPCPITTAITTNVVDIRAAIEIVVHVDVDVVVSPAGVPAPASSAPCSADGNSNAE